MKKLLGSAAAAALFVTAVQPCLAADDFRDLEAPGFEIRRPTAIFAGANLRAEFGGRRPAAPVAQIQLAHQSGTLTRTRTRSLVELRSQAGETPSFRVVGQDVANVDQRLGLSTGAAVAIGVGVVAILAVAAVAGMNEWEKDDSCLICSD